MSFYVCGDTHIDLDIRKLFSDRFDSSALTKKDYVLICGDCGVVWDMGEWDAYIRKWYHSKPWTTLYIDGNHENHDALDRYPVTTWSGGKVHRISDFIIHLMRGQIYDIDGHRIFTMGGAESHDREFRREGISWWAREMPSDEEYRTATENLAATGNTVDYIFTHCASQEIQKKITRQYADNCLTAFFNRLEKEVEFKHWYFGHYHCDRNVDEKHTALFNKVIRLW